MRYCTIPTINGDGSRRMLADAVWRKIMGASASIIIWGTA